MRGSFSGWRKVRKYGRAVGHGDEDGFLRLVDVVEIPDAVEDPAAWLDVMFAPQKEAWADAWFVPCPDDAANGMSYKDGVFGEPPAAPAASEPAPAEPQLPQADFEAQALKILQKVADKLGISAAVEDPAGAAIPADAAEPSASLVEHE